MKQGSRAPSAIALGCADPINPSAATYRSAEVLNGAGNESKLRPQLTLFAQLNNALDRRYNSAAQLGAAGFDAQGRFVARPIAANPDGDRPLVHSTFFAPGAPRGLWLGLRCSLGR